MGEHTELEECPWCGAQFSPGETTGEHCAECEEELFGGEL